MRRRIVGIFTAAILCFSVLSGCSQSKDQAANGQKKDELTLAVSTGMVENGFDPTTGWGRYGSPLFQSTLVKRDSDSKITNDLATEYTISEDGLVWTFQLRKDVKFSDGQPLTAKDVEYTYETTAKSGSVVDLGIMESVEAAGDYTVKFTLKHPQSTFINIVERTGIVPKHAHGKDYEQNPIGSGPYKLVQWDKDQQFIVEVNPEYYEKKPFFKKVTILYLNEDAAFAAAKAGTVDVAAVSSTLAKQSVSGMRLVAIDTVDNRGILFPYVKPSGNTENGYPIGNEVTSDIAVRKAINVSIDRKALVDGILNGYGSPAYTICDNLPWYNSESEIKDGNIEEGKKILSESGWKDEDGDGVLEKGSLKAEFNLIYPADDQLRQSLALAVAERVKDLGIKINVEGKGWEDMSTLMYSNAIMLGWGSLDPLEVYNVHSTSTRGIDFYNSGYYSNPVVDEYMNKALAATNEKEANEYWKKAQWDGQTGFSAKGDAPWAWLVNMQHLYFIREDLNVGKQRIQPHGTGWPITDNIADWTWEQ